MSELSNTLTTLGDELFTGFLGKEALQIEEMLTPKLKCQETLVMSTGDRLT